MELRKYLILGSAVTYANVKLNIDTQTNVQKLAKCFPSVYQTYISSDFQNDFKEENMKKYSAANNE